MATISLKSLNKNTKKGSFSMMYFFFVIDIISPLEQWQFHATLL